MRALCGTQRARARTCTVCWVCRVYHTSATALGPVIKSRSPQLLDYLQCPSAVTRASPSGRACKLPERRAALKRVRFLTGTHRTPRRTAHLRPLACAPVYYDPARVDRQRESPDRLQRARHTEKARYGAAHITQCIARAGAGLLATAAAAAAVSAENIMRI